MPTLEIVNWREHNVGFTGWDAHPRPELKRRLRSGVIASPKEQRLLFKHICSRQLVTIHNIRDDYVSLVRQILETMGAVVTLQP